MNIQDLSFALARHHAQAIDDVLRELGLTAADAAQWRATQFQWVPPSPRSGRPTHTFEVGGVLILEVWRLPDFSLRLRPHYGWRRELVGPALQPPPERRADEQHHDGHDHGDRR